MKKDTKKTITSLLKRTAFLFSVAFLIYSCDSDDLDYDCDNLQADYGDACDSAGIVSTNCECITNIIIDSSGVTVYDCPDLMLNYGDNCGNNAYVDSNCDCVTNQDTTSQDSTIIEIFDCPGLMQNFGDSCWTWAADSTYTTGVIDMNCECN